MANGEKHGGPSTNCGSSRAARSAQLLHKYPWLPGVQTQSLWHGYAPAWLNSFGQAGQEPVFLENYGLQTTNLNLVFSSPTHFTTEETEA